MRRTLWIALITVAALAGCGKNPYFSDDEGAERPTSSAISDHPDEMSQPYALGTQVQITAKQLDASQLASLRIESDSPAVLSVDKVAPDAAGAQIVATCTARGEGEARLRLLDGKGAEQRKVTITVRAPDRANLYAHGPLRILGRNQTALQASQAQEARIVAGGTAAFAVVYFRGDQRVYGRGIAKTGSAPTVKVVNQTTSGVVVNEWLFITPQPGGASTLTVAAGGPTLLSIPVAVALEADLATASLAEEVVDSPEDGHEIWQLAEVRDGAGRAVHGAYFQWTLGGAPQAGKDDPKQTAGDVFRYQYNPTGAPQDLVATHGRLTATAKIRAHKGWVSDTTYLGCALGRGRGGGGLALGVALALLALFRRSRC